MAKRFTIPFYSRDGKQCAIDIYDNTYTDSTVTQLTGAATPVTWEEDNSDDLLEVIRYKTGYLNIIETYYGELDALRPLTNTQLRVEVYYNSVLVFSGFIQAQSFDNKWEASPREMSFPIISPLGLLDGMYFDKSAYIPTTSYDTNPDRYPKDVPLRKLLYDVFSELKSLTGNILQYVCVPSENNMSISNPVSSLLVCPFNSDYTPAYYGYTTDLFETTSFYEFLENFCNAYGFMVHETPTHIVFTRIDGGSAVYQYSIDSLASGLSGTQQTTDNVAYDYFTNIFEERNIDGDEGMVMPVSEVVMEYNADYIKSAAFDFDHLRYSHEYNNGNLHIAYLTSYTPELTGTYLTTGVTPTNAAGAFTGDFVMACMCGMGQSTQKKTLLMNFTQATGSTQLFAVRFYQPPTNGNFFVKTSMRWGSKISDLGNESVNHRTLGIVVRCVNEADGIDQFWTGQEWQATRPNPFGPLNAHDEYLVSDCPRGTVIVEFYQTTATGESPVSMLALDEIRLEEVDIFYAEYKEVFSEKGIMRAPNGDGKSSASISQGFTYYRYGANMVGSTLITTPLTTYAYLRSSQRRMVLQFKYVSAFSPNFYNCKHLFKGVYWRIIAADFNPIDDEWTLTLQHTISQ